LVISYISQISLFLDPIGNEHKYCVQFLSISLRTQTQEKRLHSFLRLELRASAQLEKNVIPGHGGAARWRDLLP
jgi:hypothetical protein